MLNSNQTITPQAIDVYSQLSQIQNVMDQYASLEYSKAQSGLEFIVNCYLVAVGFRPVFLSDVWHKDLNFHESLIQQSAILFPQLSFYRDGNYTYIHHPLLKFEIGNDKELGALLNFIDFIDLDNKPEDTKTVEFVFNYKNVTGVTLTSYIIRGSTSVNQVTNKLFQLNLLLKNINVQLYVGLQAF
jgi:hypothetical protein